MSTSFLTSSVSRTSKKHIVALLFLSVFSFTILLGCKPDADKLIKEGKEAFYSKDYVKAKNAFTKLADSGNSQGQFWLARLIKFTGGRFSDTDTLKMSQSEREQYVYELFKKSADQNDGDGYAGLYLYYLPKDKDKANEYLEKSVELNSPYGNVWKAETLLAGNDNQKDFDAAINLIKKSVDANEYEGVRLLGACYLNGLGVEEDVNKGIELLKESAGHNCATANDVLAGIYFDGFKGIEQDYTKAASYANSGSNSRIPHFILGYCYYFGKGVEEDIELGAAEFLQSARLGHPSGQLYWASICENNGRPQEAFDWYMKAADQGNVFATAKVGEFLLKGTAGRTDYSQAKKYLMAAASMGSEDARNLLNQYSYVLSNY